MHKRLHGLFAVVLVAALGAGCDVHVGENGVSVDVASGKAIDEWHRTYTVETGGSIEIVNTNGPIAVETAPGPEVEVSASRQARASSDEEARSLLEKTGIQEEVSSGRVRLETTVAPGTLMGRRSLSVEYRLLVPAGLHVSVKTQNGSVTLHGVNGDLVATTTNGSIRGTNLSGSISAHIINGGIVVDVASLSGPIELETVNGGIRLDIPGDGKAQVEAKAVNGGVEVDDALPLTAVHRSRGALSAALNGGGPAISASTVNGGVRIGRRTTPASAPPGDQ